MFAFAAQVVGRCPAKRPHGLGLRRYSLIEIYHTLLTLLLHPFHRHHHAHAYAYLTDDKVETKSESPSGKPPQVAAMKKLQQAMATAETSRAPAPLKLAIDNAVAARTAIVSSSVGPKQERQAKVQMVSLAIKRAHSLLHQLEDELEDERTDEAEHGESAFQSWRRCLSHT